MEDNEKTTKENITVKIKKLNEAAIIPAYAHHGDVCMDLTAVAMTYDPEKDMYIYHTGLSFESDMNVGQFLFLRSSNCKTDAYLCNGVGVADSAIYRGEIQFRMKNRTSTKELLRQKKIFESIRSFRLCSLIKVLNPDYEFDKEELTNVAMANAPYQVGDRVGQMVFMQYPTVELIETSKLSETERGEGGFGSTGN